MIRSFRHRRLFCSALIASVVFTTGLTAMAEDAEPAKTKEVKARDLTLKVPEDWKQEEPASRLRLTQFSIPAAEGDDEAAELAVFNFGGGSDVASNVRRWIGQFAEEGREVKILQGDGEQGKYVLVKLTGTYNKPIGPPIRQQTKPTPGSGMLAVILVVQDKGVYYLKMTGPEKTVLGQTDALRTAFGGDAESEQEVEQK